MTHSSATVVADSTSVVVLEPLEARRLLAADPTSGSVRLHHGEIVARGTAAADLIVVTADATHVVVDVNGHAHTFAREDVHGVRVLGRAGDDSIQVGDFDGTFDLPVTLAGGRGNDALVGGPMGDLLLGGAGDDAIFGAAGDDELHGGAGDDLMTGEDGNDHLFGDAGKDLMGGGLGDDVLVGGRGVDELFGEGGADQLIQ
jgi:Ca2+-binding RTX toxin-like protein